MTEPYRPGLFDRALLSLAPERGLRRLRARMAADMALRAYDGAKSDRRLGGWQATGASANVENAGAMRQMRNRARDMERNNRTVASLIQQFAGQTVSTGITPRARHEDDALRQKAMSAWARFADTSDIERNIDYYGQQQLTVRSMFRDGECFNVWVPDKTGVHMHIQVLEADHLDETRSFTALPGKIDRQGIQFDQSGARTGYWIFPTHPGESGMSIHRSASLVPAADIDHFYNILRPGQVRGVSWLAPAMTALRGLDDIDESVRWRKRLEACIGLVLSSPEMQGAAPVLGEQTKAGDRVEETMRPGMVLRTKPGEQVTAFQPSSSGDSIDYVRQQTYAICAVTGIPYHAATGDVSQANYSSLRAAEVAGQVVIDLVQWIILAPRIKAAWRRVMYRESVITNNRHFMDVACDLSMPVRPWVDPLKDITAKVMEIRAGLQSMPDALAQRGLDWLQQFDEIEACMKAQDARGIILDTDARQMTRAGQLQQALVTGQQHNN